MNLQVQSEARITTTDFGLGFTPKTELGQIQRKALQFVTFFLK
jgi:hypothetical protein